MKAFLFMAKLFLAKDAQKSDFFFLFVPFNLPSTWWRWCENVWEHVGTLTDPSLWMNTGGINRQHFRNVKENNSKKENYYCTLQTPFWREKHCCVGGELCPLHRLHILLFDNHTSFSDFEQKNSVNALKKKNRVLTCIM